MPIYPAVKNKLLIFIAVMSVLSGVLLLKKGFESSKSATLPTASPIPTPLTKYSIPNLQKSKGTASTIKILGTIKTDPVFTSHTFVFTSDGKNISGLINIPNGTNPKPLLILVRGYVEQNNYTPGLGSQHVGEFFASKGFITVAPDFAGYGASDKEAEDIFEARFQTYTTVINLLASINSIPGWDGKNVFLWGHSNGGQIALTVLEVTGSSTPTVLWAPVSKPFPYSILYYTDDAPDGGKLLRREVARFESIYDSNLYSVSGYFGNIKAPIQLDQGTNDDAVRKDWSDSLAKSFKDNNIEYEYNIYPGADHNMTPSWDKVVEDTLKFYQAHLTI